MKKTFPLFVLLLTTLSSFAQVPEFPGFNLPIEPVSEIAGHELPPQEKYTAPTTYRSNIDPLLADTLEKVVQKYWDNIGYVGLSAALMTPEGDIWAGAEGMSSETEPLTPDHSFGMGSNTKTIAAAAIMKLVEDGLVELDDPLDDYLPSYQNVDSSATIRQILQHTSGIYNFTDSPQFSAVINADLQYEFEPEEIFEFVSTPNFMPGNGWSYSNTNFILAGLVVEAASGISFHEYVRTNLIAPLNLESVALFPQEDWPTPKAHLWLDLIGEGTQYDLDALGIQFKSLFSGAWSAGAYVSTPSDLARWMNALYTNEILDPASVTQMKDYLPIAGSSGYGLGTFYFNIGGYDAYGHGGEIVYSSYGLYFPELDIAIAVMENEGEFGSTTLSPLVEQMLIAFEWYNNTIVEVSEAKEEIQATIFPNPSTGSSQLRLNLAQSEQVQLNIFNALGQQIYQRSFDTPQGIFEVVLPPMNKAGLYHCTLQTDQAQWSQQWIQLK